MERCEKGKPDPLHRVRSMRTKSGYVERLQTAEKNFCVPLSTTADPADLKSQLTQAQLEKYSRAYDDSPHVSLINCACLPSTLTCVGEIRMALF